MFDTSGQNRNQGFTLIELLVVLLISALLMAGFTGFYLSEQRALRHHDVQLETSQGLRTALEQMARDLRNARKDITRDRFKPGTNPGAGAAFLSATATAVEFQLDADNNGAIDPNSPNEHKGFSLSGTNLTQLDASTGTWNILAENVSALTFTYLDCNGAATATLDNIATVGISITVSTPQKVGGIPFTRTETENVRLRNKVCS